MKRLEKLPEITQKALGGLTADEALKTRILEKAKNPSPARRILRITRFIPAAAAAIVLAVGLAVGIPALTRSPSAGNAIQPTMVLSASLDDTGAEESIAEAPESQDSILMITRKAGSGSFERERAELLPGAVRLQSSAAVPSYRSIWETSSGSTFPLICVDGKYYRMLTAPTSISESRLGAVIGTVSSFTDEPALAGISGIVSNSAAEGETVYGISGMDGTLIAAKVDGSIRLFQRVSFNGCALRGSEALTDTLQISGHITGMELSNVGTVTDPDTCESLFDTLAENAVYESSGSVSGNQSLLIQLDNGLTLQLAVKGDRLAACGVWSCPEFFEAFSAAVQ